MIFDSTHLSSQVHPEAIAATIGDPIDVLEQNLDSSEQIKAFDEILQRFEQNTLTERDKGTAFELLVRDVLSHAQPWCDQFVKVQTYAEWAKEHKELTGGDARDTGVDLVATSIDTTEDIENSATTPPPLVLCD